MKTHELKILPQYFQSVWNGTKTFELRKDDRDYQRGDILVLREWDSGSYTGSAVCVKVTYILQDAEKYGLQDGYIIMGILHIESNSDFKPQTNADRIRALTDEELAEYLWDRDVGILNEVKRSSGITYKYDSNKCKEDICCWLKQEAEG